MRQVFILSEAFHADMNSLLPAWWYAPLPTGARTPAELTEAVRLHYKYVHYGFLLQRFNYIDLPTYDTSHYRRQDHYGNQINFYALSKTRNSVMACPDAIPDGDQRPDFYQSSFLAEVKTNRPGDFRAMSKTFSYDNQAYSTNYMINKYAGSYDLYIDKPYENRGYYPIRGWKNNPSQIGYIFENNHPNVDGAHWLSDHKYPNGGSWYNRTFNKYNPVTPHLGWTKSNTTMADGHVVTLGDKYGYDYPTYPYKWY